MTALTIVLGLLPGFAWLFFYLQEDLHPEPKRLILKTFFFGGVFAFFALFAQLFVDCGLINGFAGCQTERSEAITLLPIFLVIFAFIEEILKFGAAYFAVHKHPAFNEPVDAMIYMVVAAMGFATVENLGALNMDGPANSTLITTALEIVSLRFIGATLLHSLASGIVGYWWAISIRDFGEKKFIFLGIVLATGLHALFNFFIIRYESMVFPVLLVIIAGFFILNDFEKLKRREI